MDKKRFPSPHSGILFLSICACTIIIAGCKVSVPSFGDSFFILPVLTLHGGDRRRVSVPSFGDSFFMKLYAVCLVVTLSCFRPLIRGFFFYCHCILLVRLGKRLRFRPLIRGFFFYVGNVPSLVMAHQRVSVPSFGDSFFMVKKNESNDRRKRRFPSPHSGILFLYIMKISSIIGKLFPSPHSGILFL